MKFFVFASKHFVWKISYINADFVFNVETCNNSRISQYKIHVT